MPSRSFPSTNDRTGITTAIDIGATVIGRAYATDVDPVYSVAKAAFWPFLRYGLRWTIEGVERIPTSGPVLLASNHTSYLDPLALAYIADRQQRRVRFLAKVELFDKRVLGTLLRSAHQIPVQRGKENAAGALSAAVDALDRGECVVVFPEGTISEDLEPMRGKSGTARLAQQAEMPIVPIGLWGAHRILTKGRKPHWRWGVAQTAVIGEPVQIAEGEHVKAATDRLMDAISTCVARAREIYPQQPEAGADEWWVRSPDTARAHRRSA
jgi:1-acyl-sn-glycerol-3-phosphate acyltransferase